MGDNNIAWACRNCGVITEHSSATEKPVIRKTTICLKCFRDSMAEVK